MTDSDHPQEPGLLSVMQNQLAGVRNPFTPIHHIDPEKDSSKEFTVVFSGGVAEELRNICADLGFSNPADFINTAVSIYGQMLGAAKNDGFSRVLMVNPDTEKVIQVPLTTDDVQTD